MAGSAEDEMAIVAAMLKADVDRMMIAKRVEGDCDEDSADDNPRLAASQLLDHSFCCYLWYLRQTVVD